MSNAMEQLYQQVILDHSRQRFGEREIDGADGESFQVNPTCGDECRVKVKLSGNTIETLAWTGRGCSISQASLSVMHQMVEKQTLTHADQIGQMYRELMHGRGKELDEDKQEQLEDLSAFTGVARYPARIKCALLGWMALRDALAQAQYGTKKGEPSD